MGHRVFFPQAGIINRGFGGCEISDVNYFINETVIKYKPKLIVFYAGDNDIGGGKTAKCVFDDFKIFVNSINAKLPDTKIIFISIKCCEYRWSYWPEMKKANEMISQFCGENDRLYYFDAASLLLDDVGRPKLEFFMDDKLHLSEEGYRIWTEALAPMIKEALN